MKRSRFTEEQIIGMLKEQEAGMATADVYFGRGPAILAEREKIKAQTIQNRRLIHQRQAA